jgi:sensor histidine kinase YesM
VDGDPSGIWIAPMTLIPFVENAFKHSEARKADGAIVSRVTIDGRRVTFECANHFRAGDGDTGPGGIGHALIRQRLELLYRNRHTLEAGPHGDQYRVHLTIETADDPLRHR